MSHGFPRISTDQARDQRVDLLVMNALIPVLKHSELTEKIIRVSIEHPGGTHDITVSIAALLIEIED